MSNPSGAQANTVATPVRRMVDVPCPGCGHGEMDVFFAQSGIPTNSCLLLDTRDEATEFPTGDLELGFCHRCGFVANTVFEEAEYSQRYEETQGFSKVFVEWAKGLAARWVERYDLAERTVLEIGCGKGEFLVWMVEAGAGRGIGIDPGVHPERIETTVDPSRLEWIADFYSEKYTDLQADVVVCRHTLEHIAPVNEFLSMIRRSIGDRTETVVLFELPDVRRVLEEVAFWDVYHEHCSYFSLGSLARLFRATGFEVLGLELDYDDQYLLIEARPSTTPAPGEPFALEDDLEVLARAVDKYCVEVEALRESWRHRLAELRGRGGKAVIWGAGSKGVSFLTNLGLRDEIEYAVDINPYKTGKFMAGTGHEIVAPEFLVEYRPDLVIAMNPIYLDEIRAQLDQLGLHPELIGA
ncbi:MAG: class I SAM-dependent methyltransferase [Acidimicrobiia bacterium]|nr:class I SAM-dependent methyltransferase [Acidimicrobiia bacterium]